MEYFQVIPLLALAVYFFYLLYYYVAPMFWLKCLLFYAHIKYRGAEIRFSDMKISVKYIHSGEERLIERPLDLDVTSRFFAMAVCSEFGGVLREMRLSMMPRRRMLPEYQQVKDRVDRECKELKKIVIETGIGMLTVFLVAIILF